MGAVTSSRFFTPDRQLPHFVFLYLHAQGEFDAMAVYQATGMPAISLPNGASSLPLGVLPLLERFDKLYLWMDHDGPGQAGVEKFVQKLVRSISRDLIKGFPTKMAFCLLSALSISLVQPRNSHATFHVNHDINNWNQHGL